jgi:glycosyltransferase involved in cell wall biosynthesis
MKILSICTYEACGGAAKAASRLHRALIDRNVTAKMLVREKYDKRDDVIKVESSKIGWLRGCLDILPNKIYPQCQRDNFTSAWAPGRVGRNIAALHPGLVHLHWIGAAFLNIKEISRINAPIIWTLHDSWPFTGGCYLPGDCRNFEESCGHCVVLGSKKMKDLSWHNWNRKKKSLPVERMTIVAPSQWMASQARSSSLLRDCPVEVIPNGIDTSQFSPGDCRAARDVLRLPQGKRLILFGARHALSDPNKGFDLLCEMLRQLPFDLRQKSSLVQFGETLGRQFPDVGMEVVSRPEIEDESVVVQYYRAADLMVLPSRSENLPNMVSEAMACGLPCVAFHVGGIPEQIVHHETGCLAPPYDTATMADEVSWLLEDSLRLSACKEQSREIALKRFSVEVTVSQYLDLYQSLLGKRYKRQNEKSTDWMQVTGVVQGKDS